MKGYNLRDAGGKVLRDAGGKNATPTAKLASLLAMAMMFLTFASCGREKSGNLEFLYQAETDSYTLAYYTDSAAVSELVIPDTFKDKPVTAIAQLAIGSCDTLEKVVIGKNITSIDKWGIVDCRYLKAIEVAEENEHFCSPDGVLYSKDMAKLVTYPNAHTAEYAKDGKLLKTGSYAVAPGVKTIGHAAFYKCYALESVTLPDGLETIEDRAFHKCESLAGIELPEGLRSIGKDAFLGCKGLTEVTLPSTIRSLGDYVFYNADNIKTIRFLGDYVFYDADNIKKMRIEIAQENVQLGFKWYPTSAGQDISWKLFGNSVEIVWGNKGGRS